MSGMVAWPPGRKEELVLPPLMVERTSAEYLIAGIIRTLAFIRSLPDIIRDTGGFEQAQFLAVADSASANCRLLAKLFSYLQQECPVAVGFFSPCLLHQMSRLLVLNLERQGVCSPLPLIIMFLLRQNLVFRPTLQPF